MGVVPELTSNNNFFVYRSFLKLAKVKGCQCPDYFYLAE